MMTHGWVLVVVRGRCRGFKYGKPGLLESGLLIHLWAADSDIQRRGREEHHHGGLTVAL